MRVVGEEFANFRSVVDVKKENLNSYAEKFLISAGMEENSIAKLKEKIGD